MTDQEALREYVRTGSAAAFERVVAAHADFVYSSARRRVRDAHLAEDVTQVVFLMLLRKARSLGEGVPLAGWLFRATQFAAADALKMERRRKRHESEAAQVAEATRQPDERWQRLAPHLEEGLARLNRRERDAVLLRYFRSLSLRDTAEALGVSADAAAQRVSRGVRTLREFFRRRGIVMAQADVESSIASNAVGAAPAGLVVSIVRAAEGPGAAGAGVAGGADRVLRAMGAAKVKAAAACAAVALAAVGALAPRLFNHARPSPSAPAPAAADVLGAAVLRTGPQWDGFPIAPGWPVGLPGDVTGTPTPADIDGDGKPEILVPCIYGSGRPPVLHPRPRIERLLFAFRADGTPVKGWPAVIMDRPTRLAAIRRGPLSENWSSTPSVMDWDHDGRDEIVILDRTGTVAVEDDGAGPVVMRLAEGGDGIGTAPLADLNGDGVPDLAMGYVLTTVEGKGVRGWPVERKLIGGFAPAIGDANGDGRLELYHPYYVEKGTVCGYDTSGRELPGWPQAVSGQCQFAPVLGDVDGDGTLEVVAAHDRYLSIWHWDGRPLQGTKTVGRFQGVFKEGISASAASPTVVDLDGDGAGEVIVFDRKDRSIKAWRGDGRGFTRPDGVLVVLPEADCQGGVTVADIGADDTLDLFVATYWVRVTPVGEVSVTPLLPEPAATNTQCTITDLDLDGKADVVFGLRDGRVFVYQTGARYVPERAYWPTQGGNVRHTGTATAPRAPKRPAGAGPLRPSSANGRQVYRE